MDEKNDLILIWMKRLIEDAMENEIDEDKDVPITIINLLANLHSELKKIYL